MITCPKCSTSLTLETNLKRKPIKADIYEIYIRCHKCRHNFHSYYETKELVNLQNKLKEDKKNLQLILQTKMLSATKNGKLVGVLFEDAQTSFNKNIHKIKTEYQNRFEEIQNEVTDNVKQNIRRLL